MQFLEEEEEALGTPTFEVLVRDGEPVVAGSYFMSPPIYLREASWDPARAGRLIVTASDGSRWHAEDVPREGRANVVLRPLDGGTPA
ncbi:hypothetical protein ABGB12_29905 [Actinocorallia sp. B10E7]|uniref:hypothetical protein n=1 Tax=Actinocorallia sp. B10E7 TaxID=3153558 RepID=UPI00325EB635